MLIFLMENLWEKYFWALKMWKKSFWPPENVCDPPWISNGQCPTHAIRDVYIHVPDVTAHAAGRKQNI